MKAIERLFEFLDYKGIAPTRLEKETGISNGYFRLQLKNGGDLGEEKLKIIVEYFRDLNPIWLLIGTGEMLNSENENIDYSQVSYKKGIKRNDIDKEKSLIISIERMTETADRNSKTLEKIVDYLIYNENKTEKGELVKKGKSKDDMTGNAECATAS